MNSADICREKNWTVGDVLEGEEFGVTARIRITAIGEEHVLAREFRDGRESYETMWALNCREWRRVCVCKVDGCGKTLDPGEPLICNKHESHVSCQYCDRAFDTGDRSLMIVMTDWCCPDCQAKLRART